MLRNFSHDDEVDGGCYFVKNKNKLFFKNYRHTELILAIYKLINWFSFSTGHSTVWKMNEIVSFVSSAVRGASVDQTLPVLA